jgi:imidazolonepropionase-like amidohydrolase
MTIPYFISPEWLIDGTGAAPKKDVLMGIQGSTIISITESTGIEKNNQDHLRPAVLDLTGFTILPCLIDSHVHLAMSGTDNPEIRERQIVSGYAETREQIQHHLQEYFRHGVLAVRDGGDKNGYTLRYRDTVYDPSRFPYIHARFAGKAWHQSGRYGSLIGRVSLKDRTIAESIILEGRSSDLVKVVNSGLNSLREFGKQTLPQFHLREFENLVHAARQIGKRVMVHANGVEPVSISMDAGCDSIEHGFFMGRENLKKMAEKGVVWVPTAVTMKAYAQVMKSEPMFLEGSQRNLDHQLEQIQMARKYGVRTAIGTDAGSPGVDHGKAIIQEMKLFMEAGYPLEEAVMCATSVGAELLGFTKIGQLTQGMNACFLAVPGLPSELPGSLEFIEKICIDGSMVFQRQKGITCLE